MSDEIKILLTSDIHIGAESPVPGIMRINTFKKIASLAASHDMLIIAGDLSDSAEPSSDELGIVKNEIESLTAKGVAVVFNPGKGDSDYQGSMKKFIDDLPFTKVFSVLNQDAPWRFAKGDSILYLYGLPYSDDPNRIPPARISDPGFHIGIFYCDFEDGSGNEKSSGYLLKRGDMKSLNLDFYTLGSSHDFRMFKIGSRVIGAYPGSPEAFSLNETGDRYVISFQINGTEICQIKRLSVNSVKVVSEEIDCTNETSSGNIFSLIEKTKSQRTILRLRVRGMRDFDLSADEVLSNSDGFCGLYFEDETQPTIINSIHKYKSEDSLRGEFFKIISEMLDSKHDLRADETIHEILQTMIDTDIKRMEGFLCGSTDA